MTPALRDTLLRLGLPLIGSGLVGVVAYVQGLSMRDLGLVWPSGRVLGVLAWLAVYVMLTVVREILWRRLELPPAQPWEGKYSASVAGLRAVAIIVVAPAVEELVFRGLLYHMIGQTSLGVAGAVGIPAVAFALMHLRYGLRGIPFIFVSGLFYGVVRHFTGSTLLPMLFHALGNAYAVYERITTGRSR